MKFEKMKFYENFREFTKKMIAKILKKWKCEKREKEREKGIWENILKLLRKTG